MAKIQGKQDRSDELDKHLTNINSVRPHVPEASKGAFDNIIGIGNVVTAALTIAEGAMALWEMFGPKAKPKRKRKQ